MHWIANFDDLEHILKICWEKYLSVLNSHNIFVFVIDQTREVFKITTNNERTMNDKRVWNFLCSTWWWSPPQTFYWVSGDVKCFVVINVTWLTRDSPCQSFCGFHSFLSRLHQLLPADGSVMRLCLTLAREVIPVIRKDGIKSIKLFRN